MQLAAPSQTPENNSDTASNVEKAVAELPILRAFVDFLNAQLGVYIDCLSSFRGNRARVGRQVARVLRAAGGVMDASRPVVSTSYEDPSEPDVILHKISPAAGYLEDNARGGYNETLIAWTSIVFVFAFWDEDVRGKIAAARKVDATAIKVDAFGDLRLLRNSIVHNGGVVSEKTHRKLKILHELCEPGALLVLSHDQVQLLFVRLKQAVVTLISTFTQNMPGLASPTEITGIAIGGPPSWTTGDARYSRRAKSSKNTDAILGKRSAPTNPAVFGFMCGEFDVKLLGAEILIPWAKSKPITPAILQNVQLPTGGATLMLKTTHRGEPIYQGAVVTSWALISGLYAGPLLMLRTPYAREVFELLKDHMGKQVEFSFSLLSND